MNYTNLQSQALALTKRSDQSGSIIQQMIEQARIRIGADLKSLANYVVGTVTSFTDGLSALPSNYSSMVSVVDSDGIPLQFMPPGELEFNHGQFVYTVYGSDLFIPDASSTDTYTISYYAIPAALSAGADVSYGMDEHPTLWLYAVATESLRYAWEFEAAAAMEGAYLAALEAANRQGNRARFGPGMAPIASEYNSSGAPASL